jgi:hypothetical protein
MLNNSFEKKDHSKKILFLKRKIKKKDIGSKKDINNFFKNLKLLFLINSITEIIKTIAAHEYRLFSLDKTHKDKKKPIITSLFLASLK